MTHETEFEHTLKNHLAIILGYTDLLLAELEPGDPRILDIQEIHKAAFAAVAMFAREGRRG
jgi:hypothetical protein